MKSCLRPIFLASFLIAAILGFRASPAEAVTHHAKAHHTVRHTHSNKSAAFTKAAVEKARLKVAQEHLSHLSLYSGKIDGVMGSKTRAGLKTFQKQHNLVANGKLTNATYKALAEADETVVIPPPAPDIVLSQDVDTHNSGLSLPPTQPDFYESHKDFYGYYNQQYENPMMLGVPTVPSRFAHVDVHQKTDGAYKYYDVTLDSQPLFSEKSQASVIGISRTFSMQNEDAVIFTAFRPQDTVCAYKHYLLTISEKGKELREIENCTRGYQANLADDNLFIVFPEEDDKRDVGNTWRYDGTTLERL